MIYNQNRYILCESNIDFVLKFSKELFSVFYFLRWLFTKIPGNASNRRNLIIRFKQKLFKGRL